MTRPLGLVRVMLALLFAVFPGSAAARLQDAVGSEVVTADPPAHINFVDGAVVLERDGQPDTAPLNMPLLAGDRLRTQGGRVEILFADGSTLHLDTHTTVDFQSDELVRLLDGRVRLSIPGPNRTVSYRIDAPSATAQIMQPGEYRVSFDRDRLQEVEVAVLRGAAELVSDGGRTAIRAGERAFARPNAAPSYAYVFNSAAWDAFDRWSETRREQRLGLSAQYLPDEVRRYSSSFDRYGSWRHEPEYGYVWYPTVSVGWRPYYHGRWASLRPYGWTWIGADPWGWPTHHYGRWGFSAGDWFWIPGRHWAPAWVSWGYAPGYVSWCPLGWNNRPIFQFVHGRHGYDPWRGWTVVSRRHFGSGFVNVRGVSARTIDERTRGAFAVARHAPDAVGHAVPRSAAPIRSAGTAVRRSPSPQGFGAASRTGSSPVYTNLPPGESRVGGRSPRTVVAPPPGAAADARGIASDRRAVPRSGGVQTGSPALSGAPEPRTRPRSVNEPEAIERTPSRSAAPSGDRTYGGSYRSPGGSAVERRGTGGTTPAPPDGGYGSIERTPSRRPVPSNGRTYGEPYRTPGVAVDRGSPGAPPAAATTPPNGDRYPGYRRAPEPRGDADESRSMPARAAPRGGYESAAPPPPPSYRGSPGTRRQAPESARPSGPPPSSAGPSSAPRSGGEGAAGGRPRSSGGQSTGTATRRPRGGV